MTLPAGQGLAVLFVLADQWHHQRQLLAALGVEKPGAFEDEAAPAAPAGRAERIARMGGEVVSAT